MRWLALFALGLTACARTTPVIDPDAGAAADDGARDAGAVDGGGDDDGGPPEERPDAGAREDGGAPPRRCMRDADCDRGVCRHESSLPAIDLEPIGLICGEADPAPDATPGEPCHDHAECDRDLCAISGACVVPCRSTGDCGPGEICREVWVRTGARAMQHTTACTRRVTAPEGVRVAGPEPGPNLIPSEAAAVELPALGPNALVIWEGPADSEVLIERIEDRESGSLLFDVFRPLPAAPDWGIGATTVRDVATVLFPNGPRTPRSADGFTVYATATRAGPSERLILQRVAQGNVLDLDLYLVGANGWRSVDGSMPTPLAETLRLARRVLSQVGIELGEVRVHEIVGGLRSRFSVLEGTEGYLGAPPELDDLYRLSAGATRPSVHVFLVRRIDDALGIASGIPGPHAMPGTGASGVALAAETIDAESLHLVLVHEIGHFMGLFHTTELDGIVNEPLDDTPECGRDHDADADGWLVAAECADADADNVMFWAAQGTALSRQQADVMRRAYFLR